NGEESAGHEEGEDVHRAEYGKLPDGLSNAAGLLRRGNDGVFLFDAVAVEDAFGGLVEGRGVEHDALQGVAFHEIEGVKSALRPFERPLQVGQVIDLLPVDLFQNELARLLIAEVVKVR